MSKASSAIVRRRVEEVLRIRLDGAEFWDIREYAREKEAEEGSDWHLPEGGKPLSDNALWAYVRKADKLIAESSRSSRKKLLRNHLAKRRNLYAKAVAAADIKTALSVLDSEAKLLGLFPPTKVAPTTPDGEDAYDPGGFSDSEVVAILAGLASRLGAGAPGPGGEEQEDTA
jgi:hypothetical protein